MFPCPCPPSSRRNEALCGPLFQNRVQYLMDCPAEFLIKRRKQKKGLGSKKYRQILKKVDLDDGFSSSSSSENSLCEKLKRQQGSLLKLPSLEFLETIIPKWKYEDREVYKAKRKMFLGSDSSFKSKPSTKPYSNSSGSGSGSRSSS